MARKPWSENPNVSGGSGKLPETAFVPGEGKDLIEGVLKKVEDSKDPKDKWVQLMKIYSRQIDLEGENAIAQKRMERIEGDSYKKDLVSQGLEDGIKKYRATIPKIEQEYREYAIADFKDFADLIVPSGKEVEQVRDKELRKKMLDVALQWCKDRKMIIEAGLDTMNKFGTLGSARLNEHQIRVEKAIRFANLGVLKDKIDEIEHLQWKYVTMAKM